MKTNKKYIMIVTAEDERYGNPRYGLGFFADNPWEGILNDIVFGNNLGELMISSDGEDNEGLFYVLYAMESQDGISVGTQIGSGTVEWNAIEEEIQEYESQKVNETK